MGGNSDPGMIFKDFYEWKISLLVGILEDVFEISNWLMAMNAEEEVDLFHATIFSYSP